MRWPEAAADYEELRVLSGPRSGATIAIAVHSTALGPALGGARLWHYESVDDGVEAARFLGELREGLEQGGGE